MKVIYILSLIILCYGCSGKKSEEPKKPQLIDQPSHIEEMNIKAISLSNRITDCLGKGYDWTKSINIGVKQCREDILDIEQINRDGLIKKIDMVEQYQTEAGKGENAFSEEELVEEISGRFQINKLFVNLSLNADISNKVRNSQSSSYQIWYSNIIDSSYVVYLNMEKNNLKQYLTDKFQKDITEKSGEEILRLYGTHLLTNVIIGGKQQIFQINTQQSHAHQNQKSLNLEANGSLGIASAKGQYKQNEQQTNDASSFSNHKHCVAYGYKGGKCGSGEADYVFIDVASDKPLSVFIDIKDLIEDQDKINEISSILANKKLEVDQQIQREKEALAKKLMEEERIKKEQFWQAIGLEWVMLQGGEFMMGSEMSQYEKPMHLVKINDFYMTKTEVTVGQYRKCFEAGQCGEPNDNRSFACNWTRTIATKENHPINCVDWKQAREFAKWVGGDLPSEAQWEYAARSRGGNMKYPWGNEEASCEYAVMGNPNDWQDQSMWGCGQKGTWGVCSRTGGNTAQGLCDMGGNVWEWVLDEWHDSYSGAPADDSGWCSDRGCSSNTSASRVNRGGSWYDYASGLRSANRSRNSPGFRSDDLGFRVSRSVN